MPIKKNDNITLTIDGYTAEGGSVGHYEGMAIFVQGGALNDTVEAHIIKVKKSYAVGILNRVIHPSADRKEVDCGVFARCGGCCFRHITYEAEAEAKRQRIEDSFKRLAGIEHSVKEFIAAEKVDGYRNKAQYPIGYDAQGHITIGFYTQRTHRIVPCTDCKLQQPIFSEIAKLFCRWAEENNLPVYDEAQNKGMLRHLYLRYAEATGEVLVCPVINASSLPFSESLVELLTGRFPEIRSIIININRQCTNVILGNRCKVLYGDGYIEDVLCGVRVRISPLSFYQVNRAQAQKLYNAAAEFAAAEDSDTLLDLYCGAGTIGLSMAKRVKQLIGVEVIPEAVEDARHNARINGIQNARFICADASQAAAQLEAEGTKPDTVIVDPPRKGCSRELIETVVQMAPKRVVYVSCDPATLARDCKTFESMGYRVQEIKGVDMFPRTGHVETVVLLSQRRADTYIKVKLDLTELDITPAESKASYQEIKDYVFEKTGLKVSSNDIAKTKSKCGITERENYNKGKNEHKSSECSPEKEKAIKEALKHFQMI